MEGKSSSDEPLLAHFRLIEKIGEGGMGVVHKAWDTRLERIVALKLLRDDLLHPHESRIRLLREARLASSLNHPYIATIYDLEHHEGQDIIAMEFVEGVTLRARLRSGPFDLREILDLAVAIADGLGEAHGNGIIHRDIKPDNIIITPRGHPKIMDFGLAKLIRQDAAPLGGDQTTQLSIEGRVMGTVSYMSPEQAAGREIDARTDIFSLGVVLYELLTQQPPFKGSSDVDILYEIMHHDPRPLSELNPDAPADLQEIVRRCTAKQPADRYESGKQLWEDLKVARVNLDVQRARTLDTLLTISREMTSILDLEPLLDRIAAIAKSLIDYDVLGIFRVDEKSNRLTWLGGWGYVTDRARQTNYSADRGLCGRAIRTREAVRVGDVTRDTDYYPPNGEAFRSNLVVPLINKNDVIAVLNMESRRPHFFTGEHLTVISTLAAPIAVAISNADLFEEHRRHGLSMAMLHDIGREVASILELDTLLDRVGELTRKVIDFELFAIFLLDDETGKFTWRTAIGYDSEFVRENELKLGQGIITRAVNLRQPVIVDDVSKDPDNVQSESAEGRAARSELAVPLIAQERVLGVMTLESLEPGHFRKEHADLLTVLASQIAVSIENARLYREIHDKAQAREEEAMRIRERFESYVTPHIAEQVFRDPNGKILAGEQRQVSVLVADIDGFTKLSEKLPPAEIVQFLREFFSLTSHIVFKYEGTVDKFLGDALMAFYGAPFPHDPRYGPSDPQRAVFAALDMRDGFQRLRDKWWKRQSEFGAMELSIGINTGDCLLGNMGSDRRIEYTAIGAAVNQAFRLCREANPGEIRVGGPTHAEIHDEIRVEPVKGDRPSSDPQAHIVVGHKYIP